MYGVPLMVKALSRAETLLVAVSARLIKRPAPWVTNVLLPADVPLPRSSVPAVIDKPDWSKDDVSATVAPRSVRLPADISNVLLFAEVPNTPPVMLTLPGEPERVSAGPAVAAIVAFTASDERLAPISKV